MSTILESTIESVVIFPQGAQVTRVATLTAGAAQLQFGELPLGLLDDSVRLSLKDAEETVTASQLSVGLEVTSVQEKSELTQELRAAVVAKRQCDDNLEADKRLLQVFRNLPEASRPTNNLGKEPPPPQVAKQLEFQNFRKHQLEDISARVSVGRKKCREADKKLQALRIKQQQMAREVEPNDLRKAVQVSLSHPTQLPDAKITLTYRIEAARWAPAYSANFDPETGEVEFSMRALVCQASEENWDDVKLTLSTSTPTEIRECPELKSLKLGRAQAEPGGRGFRPPPLGTGELFAGFDLARSVRVAKPAAPLAPPPSPPPCPAPEPVGRASGWLNADKAEGALLGDSWSVEEDFCDDEFAEESFIESGFGGAAPMLSSAPMKKRKSGAAPGGRDEPLETTRLTADEKLWEFGQLRLPGWDDSQRGELVHQESWLLYQESIQVSHNVIVAALNVSTMLTHECLGQSLPSGHSMPQSISGFDHRYETAGKVAVPSDGQFHSLPVFSQRLNYQAEYVVVPRESLDVFRHSQTENITCHGLCPGPVDISLGEDFLHTAPLGQVEPSESFDLGLGVCQAVKVSRQTKFQESSSGLMSQTTSLPHDVTFQVVNNLTKEVSVKIRERLPEPHPDHEDDLKVERGKDGGWTPFEDPRNPDLTSGLQTSVRVAPGESSEVQLKYTISMPSKYEILGGNRREALA